MDSFARRFLQIAALLLASLFTASATPQSSLSLSQLRDDVREASPEFVRSPDNRHLFRAVPAPSIVSSDKKSHWWRLTATRDFSAADTPQLVMSQPHFKQLEVWRPGETVAVRRTLYGPDSDLSHSALAHVIPLPKGLRAGESLYIRLSSNANLPSEFSILPLRDVYAQDNAYNRIRTFVLTALALVALLAIGFSVSLRQRGYAYLAVTLLAQIISLAIEGGDFRGNEWLSVFAMDRRTNILLNTGAVLASVRFFMFFLSLEITQPRAARVLDVCSIVLCAVLVVSTVQVWAATAYVGNAALLTVIGTVIPACVFAIRRRQREAFILLAAWTPLMFVLVVKIGGLQQWWPTYDWLQYGYPGAITFGGLGLLLGFTHKLRQLSHDRDSARQRAAYDGLTGVLSRPALEDALGASVAESVGGGNPLSVAFIDVDRFKSINDNFGHAIGDEVLRIVAMRLRNRLRPGDLLGRYGGDELIVVLPGTSLGDGVRLSETLRRAIADSPISIDGALIPTNVSVGVAQLRAHESASSLMKRADEALYASKAAGRGRVSGHGEHAEAMP